MLEFKGHGTKTLTQKHQLYGFAVRQSQFEKIALIPCIFAVHHSLSLCSKDINVSFHVAHVGAVLLKGT